MSKTGVQGLVCWLMVCGAAWASAEGEGATTASATTSLEKHTRFLAGPDTQGRKPLSRGSKKARAYIVEKLLACGAEPWGTAESLEQSIHIGTNIVGILKGSDENLSREYVLVSAHYDHEGKERPGASDNAAGVAALLELAERLSKSPERPRRSIILASFDCEETALFGAYAFTCRADYNPSEIAAVVNLDTIGRPFLDSLQDRVIAVGTETHPELRAEVKRAFEDQGLGVLPLAGDVVGPRSDHAAFEDGKRPCVFITAGPSLDYHKKGDTPERIDYGFLERTTDATEQLVRCLTDTERLPEAQAVTSGDQDELLGLKELIRCTASLLKEQGRLSAEEEKAFQPVLAQLDNFARDPAYGVAQRQALFDSALQALPKGVFELAMGEDSDETDRPEETGEGVLERGKALIFVMRLLATERRVLSEGHRGYVRHVLERRPLPLVRPIAPYRYEKANVSDSNMLLLDMEDGRFRFEYVIPSVSVSIKGLPPHGSIDWTLSMGDLTGRRDELVDSLLMQWFPWNDKTSDDIYGGVLKKVTGQSIGTDKEAWLQWRLRQGGFANREAWIDSLLRSTNEDVLFPTVAVLPRLAWELTREQQSLVRDICENEAYDAELRSYAVALVGTSGDREALLMLVRLLKSDARSGLPRWAKLDLDETYAFHTYPLIALFRKDAEDRKNNPRPEHFYYLWEKAMKRLEQLTGRDYGRDEARWLRWIDKHVPEKAETDAMARGAATVEAL